MISLNKLEKNILFLFIIILIYKNLILFFSNTILTSILLAVFFAILLVIRLVLFIKKFSTPKKVINFNNYLIFLIFFLLISFIISIRNSFIDLSDVIVSFRQFFLPLILVFIVMNNEYIDKLFLKKLFFISLPIFIFSIIEIFLPIGIIKTIYHSYMTSQGISNIPFETSAYFFYDFNIIYKRLGSIFFEPLTFGIFAAYIYIIGLYLEFNKFSNFIILTTGFISLVKSFYILFLCKLVISNKNMYYLFLIGLFFALLLLVLFSYNLSNEELKIIFFTLGNHIYGLISGLLNGIDYPFIGHGLGTAGYLNAINHDEYYYKHINYLFKDNFDGIGNESGLGIMIYQLGYIFTIVFLLFKFSIIKMLIEMNEYKVVSIFVGNIIVFILSESYYTLLLFILPYIICKVVINERKNQI